ncbi:MAG TPA: two-component regulator propeller domain-containing protein [Saprospiraceae bacterium]|nr:two-component regulator propeller domain-containing protein [Saprospiraceae bacterium]
MKKKFIKLLLFIACLCICFNVYAQQPAYLNYSVKDGLPSNTVYCSFQDSKGYIWLGTDRGVVRYDGYQFTVYTTTDGLADNMVFDIYEDSKNRIRTIIFSTEC